MTATSGDSRQKARNVDPTTGQLPQLRPLFLVTSPQASLKPPWALFLSNDSNPRPKKERLIRVVGNLLKGFKLEITRNYELSDAEASTPVELGLVPVWFIRTGTLGDEKRVVDNRARDAVDDIVLTIAPPKSIWAAKPRMRSGPRRELPRDSQWWVEACVRALVEAQYLVNPIRGTNKGHSPVDILMACPKH